MTEWSDGFIESNGIRIHYTRTGGSKPPFVLAHGFSDDGLCWTPVAEVLSEHYDVVMVDARGHGRSDGPGDRNGEGYSPAIMADDLAGLIQGLGLDKPLVLGHSMGGATTYLLAGKYPDLPGAILIEDSGIPNLTSGNRPGGEERRKTMGNWIIDLKRKSREEMIAICRENSPTWPEAELGPWADSKLRFSLHGLNRLGTVVDDWEQIVGRITCPALLITADPDRGSSVTAEAAAAMQKIIPQLQVVHVAGAGHNIRREQFAAFMESVQNFITG